MRHLLPPPETDPVTWLLSVAVGEPMLETPLSCSRANVVIAAVAEPGPDCDRSETMLRATGQRPGPVAVRLVAFGHDQLGEAAHAFPDAVAVVWFRAPRGAIAG